MSRRDMAIVSDIPAATLFPLISSLRSSLLPHHILVFSHDSSLGDDTGYKALLSIAACALHCEESGTPIPRASHDIRSLQRGTRLGMRSEGTFNPAYLADRAQVGGVPRTGHFFYYCPTRILRRAKSMHRWAASSHHCPFYSGYNSHGQLSGCSLHACRLSSNRCVFQTPRLRLSIETSSKYKRIQMLPPIDIHNPFATPCRSGLGLPAACFFSQPYRQCRKP